MKNTFKKISYLVLALVVAIGLPACMKDDDIEVYDFQKYLDLEAPVLEAYVNSEPGLEGAVRDSSGIWYKIIEPGLLDSTDRENYYRYNINNANSIEAPRLWVNYEGKLVSNGFVFDEAEMKPEDKPISLANVLYGWQLAFLPKHLKDKQGKVHNVGGLTALGLQKGAKIRIVLPSPYGYQNVQKGSIPANSPLDFYIEVLEVKPPAAPTAN